MREKDSLALSSRNSLLSKEARLIAPTLYDTLKNAISRIKKNSDIKQVEFSAQKKLTDLGWIVDYVEIRRQEDLLKPIDSDKNLVILGAAYYENVRLIDNIEFCTDDSIMTIM